MANNRKQPNQFSGLSGIGRRAYDTKSGRRVTAAVAGAGLIGGLAYLAAKRTDLGRSLVSRFRGSSDLGSDDMSYGNSDVSSDLV